MTRLIIGLGNPEPRYDLTRHNVGFWAVSQIAGLAGLEFAPKSRFRADIAEMTIGDERVILARPTTYYNLVGESARAITDFYKIPLENILVIHDDLALDFGTVRTRIGGSDAGNNGIKSLNTHLGVDTRRVRIGVCTAQRQQIADADFVLSKFSTDEIIQLTQILPQVTDAVDAFIAGQFRPTTHRPQA